jgi:hypothetical protein
MAGHISSQSSLYVFSALKIKMSDFIIASFIYSLGSKVNLQEIYSIKGDANTVACNFQQHGDCANL